MYSVLKPKQYTGSPNPHSDRRPFGTTYSADLNDSLMLWEGKKNKVVIAAKSDTHQGCDASYHLNLH